MRIISAFYKMSLSEKHRVIGSIFVVTVFFLHIVGLKVPIGYFPYCFSMYILQHNDCSILIKIPGFIFSLCPFLFILVLSGKYNRLFSRIIVYVWLLIDVCFIITGFNPTEYQPYEILFQNWSPFIAVMFDCFLFSWTLQMRSQQVKKGDS